MPRIEHSPYLAFFTSDLHLRDDVPECRNDDFVAAMERKLAFITELCNTHDVPLLVAGDLFHRARPSPITLERAFRLLPRRVVFVTGQHDLPEHSEALYGESGCAVLESADPARFIRLWGIREAPAPRRSPRKPSGDRRTPPKTDWKGVQRGVLAPPPPVKHFKGRFGSFTMRGAGWGEEAPLAPDERTPSVLLLHRMVWEELPPFPGAPATGKAAKTLQAIPGYDLIITGDNHKQFMIQSKGRTLVNCGSLLRTTVDQRDHVPAIWGWRVDGTVERIPLPIEKGVVAKISTGKRQEDSKKRLAGFIERVRTDVESGLDFADNLRTYISANKPRAAVKELLLASIGSRS